MLELPFVLCQASKVPLKHSMTKAKKEELGQIWRVLMNTLKHPYCEGPTLNGTNTKGQRFVMYDDINDLLDLINQTIHGSYCAPIDNYPMTYPFKQYPKDQLDFLLTIRVVKNIQAGGHWELYPQYFMPLTAGAIAFGGLVQFLVFLRLLCRKDSRLNRIPTPVRFVLLISSFILMGPVVTAIFGAYYTLRHREKKEIIK